MSTPERDKHFAHFAKQQFDDVEGMFMKLASAPEAEQAEIANDIQLYMARRAYDLVSEGEEMKEALDHVDGCMDMLGISLNLTDPEGSLSSKKYIDEHTATMWNAIKDDYRKLSDAIHALRQEQQSEEPTQSLHFYPIVHLDGKKIADEIKKMSEEQS